MNSGRTLRDNEMTGRPGGFTLVELLVSMVLLSLLLGVLFGGLRFGQRAWRASDTRVAASSRMEDVEGFLRQELDRVQPETGAGSAPAVEFDGRPNEVEFVAPLFDYLAVGGLYRIALRAQQSERGRRLFMSWRPYGPSAGPRATGEDVLLDGASAIEFAYFGPGSDEAPPGWHPTWNGMSWLPSLIRMRVRIGHGDAAVNWPDLVVRPRIAPQNPG